MFHHNKIQPGLARGVEDVESGLVHCAVQLSPSGEDSLSSPMQTGPTEAQALLVHDLQHIIQDGGPQVQVQGEQGASVRQIRPVLGCVIQETSLSIRGGFGGGRGQSRGLVGGLDRVRGAVPPGRRKGHVTVQMQPGRLGWRDL